DTTSTSCGVFRNDSRRVPKWYTSAPNGSGRNATDGLHRYPRAGSKLDPARTSWLVDTAHAVDRDLLDQGLLDDSVFDVLLLGHVSSSGWSRGRTVGRRRSCPQGKRPEPVRSES